jgi:hypothetical protein
MRTIGWVLVLAQVIATSAAEGRAERPPSLPAAEGEKLARQLIAETLAQKPEGASTNEGSLNIRGADGQIATVSVRFETFAMPNGWTSVYKSAAGPEHPASDLCVVHSAGSPTLYMTSMPSRDGKVESHTIRGNATFVPFAGSDFWAADLGMEFLNWPKQRVLRSDMRHSRSCKVLESINPQPDGNSYSRVVSWITVEAPHAPVHAEAYDARGKLLKVFDPKSVERVHGSFQLRSIEMRNVQAETQTVMEFRND